MDTLVAAARGETIRADAPQAETAEAVAAGGASEEAAAVDG